MASAGKREVAALAAGWRPHPSSSAANAHFTDHNWQLNLRLWCEQDGVHLCAYVYRLAPAGRLEHISIAKASWRPSEVTEVAVVDWGRRALESWLRQQVLPSVEQ